MTRVVCLDAADTLFTERTSRPAMYAEVLLAFGVPLDTALLGRWMGEIHDELPEEVDGGARYSDPWFRAFVGQVLERAGSDQEPEPIRRVLADQFTRADSYIVYGDVFPTLDDLVTRGWRLAIVSNWSARLPQLLADLRLGPYFEAVSVSAIVGASKPAGAPFLHALEQLRVTPEEAVHVGNDPIKDVLGARRVGLAALLLDRTETTSPGPDTLHSLLELPGRLGD